VSQGHLGNLLWKASALDRPIAEARSEAVCRQIAAAHPFKYLEHCHVGQGFAGPPPGNTNSWSFTPSAFTRRSLPLSAFIPNLFILK
jgi:hypothetical protein